MKKLSTILAIALSTLTFSTYADEGETTLCKGKEANMFTCKIEGKNKYVSVCKGDGLAYRFGTVDNVELEYGKEFGHTKGKENSGHSLWFTNGTYKYFVYQSTQAKQSGIKVRRKGNDVSSYKCKKYTKFEGTTFDYLK